MNFYRVFFIKTEKSLDIKISNGIIFENTGYFREGGKT